MSRIGKARLQLAVLACTLTVMGGCDQVASPLTAPTLEPQLDVGDRMGPGLSSVPESYWGPNCGLCVLGPEELVRPRGAPTEASWSFDGYSSIPYRLVAATPDGSGITATMNLNGTELSTPESLAGTPHSVLVQDIALQETNTLTVTLTGKPGERLLLWIEPVPVFVAGSAVLPVKDDEDELVIGLDSGDLLTIQPHPDGTGYLTGHQTDASSGPSLLTLDLDGRPEFAYRDGRYYGFEDWALVGGQAKVSVSLPDGTSVRVTLPEAYSAFTVGWFGRDALAQVAKADTDAEGDVFVQLPKVLAGGLSIGECAIDLAGGLPVCDSLILDALQTYLDLEGVPLESAWYGVMKLAYDAGICLTGNLWSCASVLVGAPLLVYERVAPETVLVLSGNLQAGEVGSTLPIPLSVRVLDRYGLPLRNIRTRFETLEGTGVFANGKTRLHQGTDDLGVAQATFTLGPEAGQQAVQFSTLSFRRIHRTFTFEAAKPVLFSDSFDGPNLTWKNPWVVNEPRYGQWFIQIEDEHLHWQRWNAGGSGNTLWLKGATDIPVTDDLEVSFDIMVLGSSVPSGAGFRGTEWAAEVTFILDDGAGGTTILYIGYNDDGGPTYRDFTVSNGVHQIVVGRPNAPLGQWLRGERHRIADYVPVGYRIVQVSVGGAGWNFEGRMDNLRLQYAR